MGIRVTRFWSTELEGLLGELGGEFVRPGSKDWGLEPLFLFDLSWWYTCWCDAMPGKPSVTLQRQQKGVAAVPGEEFGYPGLLGTVTPWAAHVFSVSVQYELSWRKTMFAALNCAERQNENVVVMISLRKAIC